MQYTLPVIQGVDAQTRIVDCFEQGGTMCVLSATNGRQGAQWRSGGDFRIDAFDVASGCHVSGQVLAQSAAEISDADCSQVIRAGGTLIVTGSRAIQAFAADGAAPAPASHLCYRQEQTAAAATQPSTPQSLPPAIAMSGPAGGKLRVTHDADRLYLDISWQSDALAPGRARRLRRRRMD